MSGYVDTVLMQVRLDQLISGDESEPFWLVTPDTPEQFKAKGDLTAAIRAFELAFAPADLIQQLELFRALASQLVRKNAATRRILHARREINAAASRARAVGDLDEARRLEAQPTPDYPEKAADERELGFAS